MAAVAAVHNPSDTTETLLFFCSKDLQVGLSRRKEDADEAGRPPSFRVPAHGEDPVENEPSLGSPALGDDPPPPAEPPTGVIKNPSSFGAVFYKKLVYVYGIRTDGVICIVSPAFTPLKGSPKTKFNCLAVCGDGKKVGWLYYLTNDPPAIKEYRLDPGASATVQGQPDDDTFLCAYYNPTESKRYCIYQASGSLNIVDVAASSGGVIQNTTNAKAKTPMAVCVVKGTVYLYYSDVNNQLVKITRTSAGWQPPAVVQDAPPLADGTQITVTTTKDSSYNMVFYIVKDSDEGYYRYMDSL